jgi:phage terminase large subunit-like protein
MGEVVLRWRPLPHQKVPAGSWTTCVLYGGRGVGKTWNGSRWLLTQALTYPGTMWLAVGRTWSEARRILAEGEGGLRWHCLGSDDGSRPSLEFALEGGSWGKAFTRSPGSMELRLANGSTIRLASADKPNSLRGTNAHGALADEAAFWEAEAFHMLRLATRLPLPDGTPARVLCATTPNGMNWFYHGFLDPEILPKAGVAFVGGADGGRLPPNPPPSSLDNPHTDAAWRASLLETYDGTDLGRQEIYGEVLSPAGSVFKELAPHRHARSRMEAAWPTPDTREDCVIGLDLGSENPTAAVVLAKLGSRWHVVAEAVAPCATPEAVRDLVSPLIEQWRPRTIVSDTNYPQTTASLRRWGLNITDADKRAGSVLDGIRSVQSWIAKDGLAVDDNAAPVTWKELIGYRWATGLYGLPLTPERPVKRDDHTTDALRYAVRHLDRGSWTLLIG